MREREVDKESKEEWRQDAPTRLHVIDFDAAATAASFTTTITTYAAASSSTDATTANHRYVRIVEHAWSERLRRVADTNAFKAASVGLILTQAVLVGVSGMGGEEDDEKSAGMEAVDAAVVGLFCLECLVVMGGYGQEVWRYFTGLRVGKWESIAKWNCFDFVVSFVSAAMVGQGGGAVSVVRILRVVRLLKQLLSRAPGFIVIIEGLKKGLDSVLYICWLLAFVLFLFGVIGVGLFGENDPVAFGGLGTTMLTLLQVSTLSNWHPLLYTQMLGCDQFPRGLYAVPKASDGSGGGAPGSVATAWGWFFTFDCVKPSAAPVSAIAFFVVFTMLSAFVVLSLFVGTMTLGMIEAMNLLEGIGNSAEAHEVHRLRYALTYATSTHSDTHTRDVLFVACLLSTARCCVYSVTGVFTSFVPPPP